MTKNAGARALLCQTCHTIFVVSGGIPHLLKPDRAVALEKFCTQYDAVRLQEGWANENPEFYLQLPVRDLSGRHVKEWRLRARSFEWLEKWLEKFAAGKPLRVLEVGAGSGWMSQKLAAHHQVLACDVNAGRHGLSAIPPAQRQFMAVQAGLDCLPLAGRSFDMIIANASLHYAPNREIFFEQAHRALRPSGKLIVMDSPVYPHQKALQAAQQRTRAYYAQAGFPELAQNYGGLLDEHFERRPDFHFVRRRRDFATAALFKKILREKLGGEAAARFPVFIGEPRALPNEDSQESTPRAGALIMQNGKLLTYHFQDETQHYWRIPGGGVEEGETPEEAARRELHEELGLNIILQQTFGPYFLSNKEHWYFLAKAEPEKLPEENATGFEEACTVNWLPLQKLAEYDIQPPGLKWEVAEYLSRNKML